MSATALLSMKKIHLRNAFLESKTVQNNLVADVVVVIQWLKVVCRWIVDVVPARAAERL